MKGNGDVVDKGLCCGDWCVIMENTAYDDIPYTRGVALHVMLVQHLMVA
jgi:hypothetical protein